LETDPQPNRETALFRDSDPDYSPDGRRIAFASGRNGSFGIWVSDSDGEGLRLLFDGGPYVTGSPRWSPDGRRIVFDTRARDLGGVGNPSIRAVDANGGEPPWHAIAGFRAVRTPRPGFDHRRVPGIVPGSKSKAGA
jgi:Tol biopolymer transport system component